MIFDYRETEAELTYRRVGVDEWAFKKIAMVDSPECNEGPENHLFDLHRTEMSNAGWTLVLMEAVTAGAKNSPLASFSNTSSKTTNFLLQWKRLKLENKS